MENTHRQNYLESRKLILLPLSAKKANAQQKDLLTFCKSIIPPNPKYCFRAWSTNITQNQIYQLERIKKEHYESYIQNDDFNTGIEKANITTLECRRMIMCRNFFFKKYSMKRTFSINYLQIVCHYVMSQEAQLNAPSLK